MSLRKGSGLERAGGSLNAGIRVCRGLGSAVRSWRGQIFRLACRCPFCHFHCSLKTIARELCALSSACNALSNHEWTHQHFSCKSIRLPAMAPSDTSNYRPTVLLLAGFTATLAALLIHQRYLKPDASSSDTRLHRSNAVRRPNTRRRRRADRSGSSNSSHSATVSELAISRLLARDASGDEYHTFTPSMTTDTIGVDSMPEFRLIPSHLPSVADLQSRFSISETSAQQTQRQIHSEFMYSFLEHEYPPDHHIQDEEAEYLREQLASLNVDYDVVEDSIADYNAGRVLGVPAADLSPGSSPDIRLPGTRGLRHLIEPLRSADGANDTRHGANTEALDTRETVADDESYISRRNTRDSDAEEEVSEVLSLVYRIAEDSARRENYVHRGVMCNGCRVQPIQGIRYSCANCPDYDLCEDCEVQQIHIKTHIFYKVRIPAPLLGYHRPTAPTWYPGKPHLLAEEARRSISDPLEDHLCRYFHLDHQELQAHWEQFICLAGCLWAEDPLALGLAIDRDGFDKCFCPPTSLRSPPPNLIYDRMFAFYDTNNDGKIGFNEFLNGLVNLKDTSREAQLRRIFRAYDMDNDGFVSRKDFLRLFRAYYSYSKEMAIASVAALDPNRDDPYARDAERDDVRRKVEGGRPISAMFDGSIPAGHASRAGVGKSASPDVNGDLAIVDKDGVLDEDPDDVGDRNNIIGDAALGDRPLGSSFQSIHRREGPNDLPREQPAITNPDDADVPSSSEAGVDRNDGWPPVNGVEPEDVLTALGRNVPFEEVLDRVERDRIISAQSQRLGAADQTNESIRQRGVQDRWQRQRFYTDAEEGATAPPGYVEADSSDDEGDNENGVESPGSFSDSRRQSLRSRSSSKVRFEDEVTDTDYETRSNTSSRSIPVGERWGGYEVREIERDVGKEVLYQVIQQGFNELLDPLFRDKEALAIEADRTRADRRKWKHKSSESGVLKEASMLARKLVKAPQPRQKTDFTNSITLPGETLRSISSTVPDPTMPQNRPESSSPLLNGDAANHSSSVTTTSSGPELNMQQTRPNTVPHPNGAGANGTTAASPTTSRAERLAAPNAADSYTTPQKPSAQLSHPPAVTHPEPPEEVLSLWMKHDAVDAEAKKRGGHGRLNYDEFAKKMVEEDANATALGRDEDRDAAGEQKWGEKASIGRLWFVGTWIEQSSF